MATPNELALELLLLVLPESWTSDGVTYTILDGPTLQSDNWVRFVIEAEDVDGPLPLLTDDFQFYAIPALGFQSNLEEVVKNHARGQGWAG